jgi:hypothetical protein
VTPPHAVALRLVAREQGTKPPRPPLGLAAWSSTADAIAVLLDAGSGADPRTVAGVASQVPHASTLPAGTAVFVLGKATAARPFWRLFARALPVPRAVRCTALLARGYIDIAADDVDGDDLAWGLTP